MRNLTELCANFRLIRSCRDDHQRGRLLHFITSFNIVFGQLLVIPHEFHVVCWVSPPYIAEYQVGLKASIVSELVVEVRLSLAQVDHKVLAPATTVNQHLAQFFQRFFCRLYSSLDAFLFESEIMDDAT